jgi:hypothetical protein
MLVIMALVTTFMAGPVLRLLDRRNEYGAPVEEELEEAHRMSVAEFPALVVPERAILVAPQTDQDIERLERLVEPLARSEPPREVIVARLVQPPRGASARGGLQSENRLLREASEQVAAARRELIDRGVAARAVAFSSSRPGRDLVRLARTEAVELLLADGRRPLLGDGVPRGEVGDVLREAECDVAILVARDGQPLLPTPEAGVMVPFGGAEHDWAALELAAWVASATGAPLTLLGRAADGDGDGRSAARLLGDAALLVQQFAAIPATPLLTAPGGTAVAEAASGAGLLVIGLSDRWRDEGLGPTRSEIARAAPAPVIFVRRGRRPGALAPRGDVTRFTWSSPGAAPLPGTPLA